jgi:hypothetical protein
LYFPAPECGDVGLYTIAIFAWWGCSAWFNILCRTCSSYWGGGVGGRGGRGWVRKEDNFFSN